MRVLLQGDTHANTQALANAFGEARRKRCERVVQLGDLGYGFGGFDLVRSVSEMSRVFGAPLDWIDGNHENFDKLTEVGAFTATEPFELAPGVRYVPRGYVERLGDSNVLYVGGAYSVDKEWREPYVSWWPQEELTAGDVERAMIAIEAVGRVDVVLSHDAPNSAFGAALALGADDHEDLEHLVRKNDQRFPAAKANRMALQAIWEFIESAEPPDHLRWFHGHYHTSYAAEIGNTTFTGLAHEDWDGSRYVLEV